MTDDMQAIRDDIAYLKALAQGGQDGSGGGGAILMAAGGFYGIASLVQWASLAHLAPITPQISNLSWLVALVLFFVVLFVTKARQGRSQGARPAALAWMGIGWGLFAMFGAIAIATYRTQSVLLISFSPSIVMGLYGAAWLVGASLTGKLWLWATAFGSFAAALISAWLITDTAQWLFYAVSLFLLAFLPGLIFTFGRQSPVPTEHE